MFCYTINSLVSLFTRSSKKPSAESSISPFYFNSELKRWLPLHRDQIGALPPSSGRTNFDNDVAFGTWKLVCYNVSSEKSPTKNRIKSLLELLLQEDADVICLQEVVPELVEQLKKMLWVQQSYMLSEIESRDIPPQGVLMLSRLPLHPFFETRLPSKQQRKLLYADVYINEQSVIRIATTHLDDSEQSVYIREQQLESMKTVLLPVSEKEKFITSVICGDFNFTRSDEDEVLRNAHFIDAWKHIYPNNEAGAGYTSGINYPTSDPSRNDRVYIRNHCLNVQWEAVNARLIGDKPIADNPGIFPSSHLGLSFTFTALWPNKVNVNSQR